MAILTVFRPDLLKYSDFTASANIGPSTDWSVNLNPYSYELCCSIRTYNYKIITSKYCCKLKLCDTKATLPLLTKLLFLKQVLYDWYFFFLGDIIEVVEVNLYKYKNISYYFFPALPNTFQILHKSFS